MISNLRARPVQGYVTDSAGNVIRNANITIARNSPDGLITVDQVTSDDEGYFVSNPLPNGTYDIFESGIRTSRVIHSPDQNAIQCFRAAIDNYNPNDIKPFSYLVSINNLNSYKYFLQIEPEDISVDVFGNMFPIYDKDLTVLAEAVGDPFYMKRFLNFQPDSRATLTRFDVEYFSPITATQTAYRRMRWAGIPGIRFKKDSKLVVPLDYFSIVANNPFKISGNGNPFDTDDVWVDNISGSIITIRGNPTNSDYLDIYNNAGIGDIIKFIVEDTPTNKTWYGIVLSKSTSGAGYAIILEQWLSSRFPSIGHPPVIGDGVLTMNLYHGMFQGMVAMSSTVSDYFTVAENVYQQDVPTELYSYQNWSA